MEILLSWIKKIILTNNIYKTVKKAVIIIELSRSEFNLIRDFAKQKFGISLSDEKMSLVFSRLNSVIRDKEFKSFEDYYEYLKTDMDKDAMKQFIDRLTTNHTFFMREANHFDYLKTEVFPYFKQKYGTKKDIRIWCAGCSSGEEAYTLQILLAEYFDSSWNIDLLATDISTKVLKKASDGIYDIEKVSTLPPEWLEKYFKKINDIDYEVSEKNSKAYYF